MGCSCPIRLQSTFSPAISVSRPCIVICAIRMLTGSSTVAMCWRSGRPFFAVICVTPANTLEQVLDILVSKKVHRVYIRDVDTDEPVGIVTLTDLLRFLHVVE